MPKTALLIKSLNEVVLDETISNAKINTSPREKNPKAFLPKFTKSFLKIQQNCSVEYFYLAFDFRALLLFTYRNFEEASTAMVGKKIAT